MQNDNPWGEKREVLALLGATLLLVQTAEGVLKACMTYALPKGGSLTLELLERQTAEEAKKTLGYFLDQLRRRADLLPEFDAELSEFLNLRNRLVHHIDSVDGISFNTPEGRSVAEAFIRTTATKAVHIMKVFSGLMLSWAERNGMPSEIGNNELMEEIDRIYKPMIDDLFTEKSDGDR